MMKRLLALTLSLLLAGALQAVTVVVVKKPPAAGGHPSDILFWLNFESGDFVATVYTLHATNEHSAGDVTGQEGDAATAINATAAKVGSFGLFANTGGDNITFSIASSDIISPTAGRVGFWWKHNTSWVNGSRSFQARFAGSADEFYFETTGGSEARACWEITSQTTRCATSSGAGLVVDTWYYIEIVYDTAAPSLELRIDGVSANTSTGSMTSQVGTTGTLSVGTHTTASSNYVDQLVVSNDKTHNLYSDYNATLNYP